MTAAELQQLLDAHCQDYEGKYAGVPFLWNT